MTSSTQTTRAYFQQVMDEHATRHGSDPYATNRVWHQTVAQLRDWLHREGLDTHGRVLEVGSGTGLLQAYAAHYVGIDIASTAAHYMHRPFSVASATDLPFADHSFDGVWSVWVLEHVEYPERMLAELRRVVRPGGSIFLRAAFHVPSWVSRGIHRRPWRDLTGGERLIRLSLLWRATLPYQLGTRLLRRTGFLARYLRHRTPTSVHARALSPNYDTYWDYDADACVSLDAYDVALYFLSRGDEPLTPGGVLRGLAQRAQPQIYRVWHRAGAVS